ncbi:MAG: G/U mismatch-specific DNA glycosylase [Chloroflexi bacterium]|nr:G/U mismatch-specific DNA glycosylase [Chloroflexota bacterium]
MIVKNTHNRPTREELLAAVNKRVPDIIAPGLRLLLCGINPGLYTAAIGHHFGRPGNRFWPALYASGLTPRLLSPYDEHELLDYGIGIVSLVDRPTAAASELSLNELQEGAICLKNKVEIYQPRWVAVLTIELYRKAFGRKKAQIGRQPETIAGAGLWVLPNPSGLNAHFTPAALALLFGELRQALEEES